MKKVNIEGIISTLKEFGLTEYEAKIYVSLIRTQPSNGNTIANLSGVPAPKVYAALRKMKEQGLVFIVSGGNKGKQIRYSPLPYKELLKTKKDLFMNNIEYLDDSFEEISSINDTDWSELFVIEGYSASIEVVHSAIAESKSELVLSCWKKEFNLYEEPLRNAHKRGVNIITMVFDETQVDVPWVNFSHYNEELALGRHIGELALVVDNKKTILLHSLDESPHSVVSSHPVMISTTLNYIRHDIYVNRIIYDFENEMLKYYGSNLEGLINDF
ncbi:helix-turn-helix domain-containing protein [Virgibacillus sp. C22-A2]|uniref:Helix-turn-helix domain-containing protein n=1 Tax=Virgibacillus tibetensis TaxID=3042313 RepID=A0ABU6KDF8_9BACI|nr:helix-turn-helix domain-containing protein [Virgibacillus sp. C22-A2]